MVGLVPKVLLAKTEKSISEEFLTFHSSLVKPLIDVMNAEEIVASKSCLKSESWKSFLNFHNIYFKIFRAWILSSMGC